MLTLDSVKWDHIADQSKQFGVSTPFNHMVVDGFFQSDIAENLEDEFPKYDDPRWYCYSSKLEKKKTINQWNLFPSLTYSAFTLLNSPLFIDKISKILSLNLHADPGLHGGGWHIHGEGGILNPHLDYSIHPKSGMERKVNIIIYLSRHISDTAMGGHLGLWSHDPKTGRPKTLEKEIQPIFNRAVIFDTTQNSWHGLSRTFTADNGIYRKSMAIYYLQHPTQNAPERPRALFAPSINQANDPEIEALILNRSRLP